jgi:hypothetical protein
MPTDLKYTIPIKPSKFLKEDLLVVIKQVGLVYESAYKELEEEWIQSKQSSLLEKVEQHNQRIEAGKTSYFFDTDLVISDAQELITEEKESYIKQHLYDWNNRVELKYSDKREVNLSFDVVESDLDLFDLEGISIRASDHKDSKVSINMSKDKFYTAGNRVLISGSDVDWVRSKKIETEELLKRYVVKKPLSLLFYEIIQFALVFIFTGITVISIKSLIYNLPNEGDLWMKAFDSMSLLVIVLLMTLSFSFFKTRFPHIQIGDSKRFGLIDFVITTIFASIIGNWGWQIFQLVIN